ncbi:MAG: PH domain-containing protein [Thermoanaerobaculia bacterium]
MEPIEVAYEIAAPVYVRAYRRYILRKEGGWFIGAGVTLLLAAAFTASEPWLSGLFCGISIAYLLLRWSADRRVVRQTLARGRASVALTIADAGLRVRSDRGDMTLPWGRILGVAVRGDVIELDLGPSSPPVWLMASALSGAPLAAIQRQRREAVSARVPARSSAEGIS